LSNTQFDGTIKVLDRPTESAEAHYNYVERFLKNPLVDTQVVMASYAEDLLSRLEKHLHTLVLMIDQSKVNATFEVLMVSVRLRKRAVPVFWIVKETKGGIGFYEQKALLDVVQSWILEGCRVMLAGDRFYGIAELVGWCQKQSWKYRLRLKGNLCVYQDHEPDKTLDQLKAEGKKTLEKARFRSGMITPVGILHEPGHDEPWYIAMDSCPNEYKTRDYGLRWGIGVSREGHISKSVKVRPKLKGSRLRSLGGIMARKQDGEALRQHL
jgi:hypothetical protein